MKSLVQNLFVITFFWLIQSCELLGIHDPSKRNENWVWFLDKNTNKGIWVPMGDHTNLEDGNYTGFYHSGKIREKGKIVNRQKIDTVFFYDIDERLIRFSIIKRDTVVPYYLHEGNYKEYSPMGDILAEGIVKNHKIEQEKWFGPFGSFIQVMDEVYPSYVDIHNFGEAARIAVLEGLQRNDSMVPDYKLQQLDSLLKKANESSQRALENLNAINTSNELHEFKQAAINEATNHHDFVVNEWQEMLSVIKKGLKAENRLRLNPVFKKMNARVDTELLFVDAQSNFQKEFPFTDEQYSFAFNKYPFFDNMPKH